MKIKNKNKKIELLSPVGDERGLKAAINAGADAVSGQKVSTQENMPRKILTIKR